MLQYNKLDSKILKSLLFTKTFDPNVYTKRVYYPLAIKKIFQYVPNQGETSAFALKVFFRELKTLTDSIEDGNSNFKYTYFRLDSVSGAK